MDSSSIKLFLVVCVLTLLAQAHGGRIKNKIYVDFNGFGACFRRLNGTHQIGCTSDLSGNEGVLHYVPDSESMEWVVQKGPHKPYTILIEPSMFNRANIKKMTDSGKVNAFLVIYDKNDTSAIPSSGFSADKSCPNDAYGIYKDNADYQNCKNITWNPTGEGLLYEDFGLPIMALTNTSEIDYLINQCYKRYNEPNNGAARDYPLCSAQVKDRMDAAKDTPTCLRRSSLTQNLNPDHFCDALGDYNVYATIQSPRREDPRPAKSVIMAVTKLDSSSLFDKHYPGANSPVTGIVALLAAAEALGKVKADLLTAPNDIMFTFLQGEVFDYIGSSRMVYDMERGKFPYQGFSEGVNSSSPIDLSTIKHVVEVSQMGFGDQLWLHTDPLSAAVPSVKTEVDAMVQVVQAAGSTAGITVSEAPRAQPLPPASAQSFLKKINISALVLADHKAQYSNKYYNSRYDLPANIQADYPEGVPENMTYDYMTAQAKHLYKVSTVLARSLYRMATGTSAESVVVSNATVTHLLNCYLHNPGCELFREVVKQADDKVLKGYTSPLNYYVSVETQKNPATKLTQLVLARFIGDKHDVNRCSPPGGEKRFAYYLMQGAVNTTTGERMQMCIKSTVNTSEAISPAFIIKDYNWASGQYSSWTESIWGENAIMLRVFLVPSTGTQVLTLCVGLAIFLISIPTVYIINRRSDFLFGGRTSL